MLGEIENFINDRQQKDVMYVRCTPPTKIFQSGLYIYIQNLKKNMKKVILKEFCESTNLYVYDP